MKGRLFPLILCLLFSLGALGNVSPYGTLIVPVEFNVENGTYANSKIIITKKSGETVYNRNGEHNIRFKLTYGDEYLLSFSKPGYITKKILVNTTVPVEHGKQGFEPYKIGVKIFKQYEGVNIVVYNQPVGLIKYHNELDEFDYDTDYTKSILSLLTATERILEQKAAEEREQMKLAAANKPKASVADVPAPAADKKSVQQVSDVTVNNTPQNKRPSISSPTKIQDRTILPKPENFAGNKEKDNEPATGEDTKPLNNPVADADVPVKSTVFVDQDTVHFSESKNLEDLPVIHVRNKKDENNLPANSPAGNSDDKSSGLIANGNDIPKKISLMDFGNDKAPVKEFEKEHFKRTIERIVEANRVITTIRVVEGDHIAEYRHVAYSWGGEYFFVNKSTPISKHLFDLFTGN